MPFNRRKDKGNVVHLNNEVLLSCKKWYHGIYRQIDAIRTHTEWDKPEPEG